MLLPSLLLLIQESLASVVPADAFAYVEVARPDDAVRRFLASDLFKRIKATPTYEKGLAGPEGTRLVAGIAALQAAAGMKLDVALEKTAGGGVGFAILSGPSLFL